MRLLKSIVVIISFLVIFSTASALTPIGIEVNESTDQIKSDEAANFLLHIANNQDFRDQFYISTPRSKWDISFSDYYVPINSGWIGTTKMRAAPPVDTPPGKYAIYLEVKSATDSSVRDYRYLHVFVTETAEIPKEEPVASLTVTEEESTNTLLKRSYSVSLSNTGEVHLENVWHDVFSELELFLLSSEPEYTSVSDYGNKKRVVWEYSLAPGESTKISYQVSFLPLVVSAFLLLISLIMFGMYYTSSFRITKSLLISKEGGRKTLKVEMVVQNKTGKAQKNVVVEDYVPIPFDVKKKFSTVAPDSITKKGNYVKLQWKFPELAPKDERVLSYEIHSKIRVIGRITLPQAALTQKRGKTERQAFSGTVNIIGK